LSRPGKDIHLDVSLQQSAAKRPAKDRKTSSKKAHSNYAGGSQEAHASKLTVEDSAKDDVDKAVADGDKAADKMQAQVDQQDGDFNPDNASEHEVEAVPEDEADVAGESEDFILLCTHIVSYLSVRIKWVKSY